MTAHHVAKRQKLSGAPERTNGSSHASKSKLFAPFRTIGLVSPTAVPFTSLPLGKETFQITTSIGTSLQTYDLKRGLHLLFITSPQTPEPISATAVWERKVLAAWGAGATAGVWIFQRGKKVGELQLPAGEKITQLLVFGSWIVASSRSRMEVWKSSTLEHYTTLYSTIGPGGFSGCISTMPTYLNKVFAGKLDGSVDIWNVKTGKLLFSIFSPADFGQVTALQATPALSLLAIAYQSGSVVIHDVRTDTPLLSVNGTQDLAITSISFRTDGAGGGDDGRKDGVMATASRGSGEVTFWDLNNGGRKTGTLRGAHSPPPHGGISKIEFLPGQSVLLSSSMDNSLKSWIFDDVPFSPVPRALHARGGHSAPISTLLFLPPGPDGADDEGKWLLSSSEDRSLWAWSLRRDGQSSELSQGHVAKKLKKLGLLTAGGSELKAPRITCMACSMNRDGGMGALPGSISVWANNTSGDASTTGWESVVTGHEGDKFARTWFWGRKRAGRWKFPTSDGSDVTSVAISPCGTFALVGSAKGVMDMFNLQSGIHRQRFPKSLTVTGHLGQVTGIKVDSLNRTVISCGADGKVKFWDFQKGSLTHELDWRTSISAMQFHRPSDLIGMSCGDGSVRVVDIGTRKLVRELWSQGQVVAFSFSNDGRWIVSATTESILLVHDLSTGHLIEALRFRNKPVAVGFSNTGEFLATAHENSIGVHLWTNKTLFTHVPTRRIGPDEIIDVDIPTASGGENIIGGVFEEEPLEPEVTAASTIDQLSSDLLTLSLVPKSRWQSLLHLDTIRARNKPKEPPQKPKSAPFFLPSDAGPPTDDSAEPQAPASRITRIANPTAASTTALTSLLGAFTAAPSEDDGAAVAALLAAMAPSAADVAIRTLDPAAAAGELVAFVRMLTAKLRRRRDYELVQAWMAVFLRCHADVVGESAELREALGEWRAESKREAERLAGLMGYVRAVVGFAGGVV